MAARQTNPCELSRNYPLLDELDEASRRALLARGVVRTYARGEVLFDEGEPGKGLFLIESGSIKIYKVSETGREQILAVLRAGDSVAELPLFDRAPYPASAAALDQATVLFIPLRSFDEVLAENPSIALAIIRALARRMRALVELIADLSLRQVRQRLARFLLEEAGESRKVRLSLTNEELAARLGTVRDVISRTLSSLQNDGLIQVEGRLIRLSDYDGLRQEAG
jgi:CRP-like cAMP-binding protein